MISELLAYLESFFWNFLSILGEMAPYLLLGFFFAGVLHAFIPQKHISRYLGGNRFRSSLNAALLGVPLPLCSCGVIPTGMSLYKNGASKGSVNSFLISTPQTGVDSMLVTYSLLGLPFAILRPIIAFVTGILGGLLTNRMSRKEPQLPVQLDEVAKNTTFLEKVKSVFVYGFVEFLQDISKWLVIGLVLASIISALIPDNFFSAHSMPLLLQMLIMLVVSIPLYVCATASVPLAAVLILKGISPGAALVLLMAGPATNAATITVIGKVLGKRSLFAYLLSIIGGALVFGLGIDYFLPAEWFTQVLQNNIGHGHHSEISVFQIASAITLTALIVYGQIKKSTSDKSENKGTTMNQQIINVKGMTCNHCKASVESNLNKLDFVDAVEVDLASGHVKITGQSIDLDAVEKLIDSIGYSVEK